MPPPDDHGPRTVMTAEPEVLSDAAAIARLAQFHGHVGPYVVLGYRLGLHLLRRLGTPKYALDVEVTCYPRPPRTCLLDGLQLAAGCTMGKGDLRLCPAEEDADPPFRVVATARNGATVVLVVPDTVPPLFRAWFEAGGGDAMIYERVMAHPAEQLWAVVG